MGSEMCIRDSPKAFINHGDFRIEFSNADFEHDMVKADISIKRK